MSYTGSNLCNASATVLPLCDLCKGEGMVYPLVEKTCPLCDGKQSACGECGGVGYVRMIEPTRCEDCQGVGRTFRTTLALSTSSS